jgi:hypothetical protein
MEERMEVMGRCGRRQQILRGSTKSHSLEKCLWKRLWTCHNTDYGMNVEGGGKSTYCII